MAQRIPLSQVTSTFIRPAEISDTPPEGWNRQKDWEAF
jgi:hypothetical protein